MPSIPTRQAPQRHPPNGMKQKAGLSFAKKVQIRERNPDYLDTGNRGNFMPLG